MKKRFKVCYIGGKDLGKRGKRIMDKYKKYFIVKKSPIGCDYLFNLFGDKIFKKDLLDSLTYGAINFHYGHLPNYRGRFIVSHAIFNEEEEICATAHFIDEGIDTGDIIHEKWVEILHTDTAYTLYKRCTKAALHLFERILNEIIRGEELPRRKQEGKGHYYPNKPLNGDEISLRWDKKRIERFIRATTFPPFYPFIYINGIKHYVKRSNSNPKS